MADAGLSSVWWLMQVPLDYYPPFFNIRHFANDPEARWRWRQKQCIDFAFIIGYGFNRCDYYLQLEDDITTVPGYIQHIFTFIKVQTKVSFGLLAGEVAFNAARLSGCSGSESLCRVQFTSLMFHWVLLPFSLSLHTLSRGCCCSIQLWALLASSLPTLTCPKSPHYSMYVSEFGDG